MKAKLKIEWDQWEICKVEYTIVAYKVITDKFDYKVIIDKLDYKNIF